MWSIHTSLGRVVAEIMTEFKRHPPTQASKSTSSSAPVPPQQSYGAFGHSPTPPQTQTPPSSSVAPSNTTASSGSGSTSNSATTGSANRATAAQAELDRLLPTIPSSLPSLGALSAEELDRLLTDDTAFDAFYATLPEPTQLLTATRDLTDALSSKITQLDAQEPLLQIQADRIAQRHTALQTASDKYDALMQQRRAHEQRFSFDVLLTNLR